MQEKERERRIKKRLEENLAGRQLKIPTNTASLFVPVKGENKTSIRKDMSLHKKRTMTSLF